MGRLTDGEMLNDEVDDPIVTKADLSKILNCHYSTVTEAVKHGRLITTPEGTIDLNEPMNRKYIVNFKGKNSVKNTDKEATYGKEAAEIRRIEVQTEKMELAMAKDAGRLVNREFVDRFFGRVSAVIWNNLFPVGDKSMVLIAAELGINEDEVKIKIKNLIDLEQEAAIGELKRVMQELLDEV